MNKMPEDYMKTLDEMHDPEKVTDGEFEVLPDGVYQTRLDKVYITKAKKSGRIQCVIEFEIINGTLIYRKIYKYAGMETADNLDWLTRDLRKLGAPNDFKWTNIEDYFPNLLDNFYEVELYTNKKGFQNPRINKKLDGDKCIVGSEVNSNDDIPF